MKPLRVAIYARVSTTDKGRPREGSGSRQDIRPAEGARENVPGDCGRESGKPGRQCAGVGEAV